MNMRKSLAVLIFINLIALSVTTYFFHELISGSEQIFTFEQSKNRGGVTVNVLKDGKRFLIFEFEDRYVLHIGYLNRGVFLDVQLFNEKEDVVSYLARCRLERTSDGITFSQPNGYLTFVPKSVYE